jgi:hypothetical protein
MAKAATYSSVKRLFPKYKKFVLDRQWFHLMPQAKKDAFMQSIAAMEDAIISKDIYALWQEAIKHMLSQKWNTNRGPSLWQAFYAQLDEFRIIRQIDAETFPRGKFPKKWPRL